MRVRTALAYCCSTISFWLLDLSTWLDYRVHARLSVRYLDRQHAALLARHNAEEGAGAG
jgi:hypothetical protein